MRKLIVLLICLLPVVTNGQSAKMSFQVKVINDAGEAMPDCEVVITTFDRWVPGTGFGEDIFNKQKLRTDEEGVVRVTAKSKRNDLHYSATAPSGYYRTRRARHEYSHQENGRWQPDNQKFEVVLKRIKNPIPMYARNLVRGLRVPIADKQCSFDFEIGDWVAPQGRGKVEDIVFHVTLKTEPNGDFRSVVDVSFVREKDGLMRYEKGIHTGSKLRSDYEAPDEGYVDRVTLIRTKVGHKYTNSASRNANYYFRVRTELDEEGDIISANYGKIYGDFMYFTYYFNPTPNDRNLEFDPERNRFPGEDINEP